MEGISGSNAASHRELVWPDGSVYRITRSSAETGGELLEMEWELPAGGWAPRPHVHPSLVEEYEVLEGRFDVLVDRRWRTLAEGERAAVPAGAVHTFKVGEAPVRVRNVHRPALDFEPYISSLCRAARRHDLGDLTGVRALVCIATLVHAYPEHSRAPSAALNAAVPALAAVGRLVGYGERSG